MTIIIYNFNSTGHKLTDPEKIIRMLNLPNSGKVVGRTTNKLEGSNPSAETTLSIMTFSINGVFATISIIEAVVMKDVMLIVTFNLL